MKTLSVSNLNLLIQKELSLIASLRNLEVEAEVGRVTRQASGHIYFTIKDAFSSIDCVMFRSSAMKLKTPFKEGDHLLLKGQISIYDKTARLQFMVTSVEPLGEGALLRAFYERKERFEKEGLLDPASKRPIKKYPKKLALITSQTAAAKTDFLKVFLRKNPFCEVVLFPVSVQGEKTVPEIVNAIKEIDESFDTVVITRGGGSYEDLSIFNDEFLCREVHKCKVPTISAIGHEIDFTLVELVSDLRAQTPTEAAERATENVTETLLEFELLLKRGMKDSLDNIAREKHRLKDRYETYYRLRMESRIAESMRTADRLKQAFLHKTNEYKSIQNELLHGIRTSFFKKLSKEEEKLEGIRTFLLNVNPLATLERGYSYVYQDQKISSVEEIDPEKIMINIFRDGKVHSEIKEIIRNDI
ncbi:exodeoxyribonuclease VII large subunit [Guggenheimella bovis]